MIRINLLPVRVSKKREAGKQQLVLFALVVVLGVIVNFLWASSRQADLKARQARIAKTRSEIAQLDRIIGEVRDIKEAQKSLKEKLDVLDRLKAGRIGPVRMLDELATITPKRLWLTTLSEGGGTLSLTGLAASIDDVSEFMSALKASPYFGEVELKKTSAKVERGMRAVDFSLTAKVKQPGPTKTAAAAPAAPPAKP